MEGALRRGLQWLLSMQNRDGGWGAFDRDNDRKILCNIPFADHNAMIDPSTADVTARVLECLGRFGWTAEHPSIQRAMKFLLKDQCKDGSWFGRWGVNYVYGTSGVLRALETVSLNAQDYCKRAVVWLKSVQQPDGSFGESLRSYHLESSKGQGNSTPSQTAWGLIGLLAAADPGDPAISKAAAYLVQQQNEDGSSSKTNSLELDFRRFHLKITSIAIPGDALAGSTIWRAMRRNSAPSNSGGRVPPAKRILRRT
jgi:squalene-hopene/tetraprenyl-beta-curcumene cyclase